MELRADGETYSWNGSMITRLENLAVNGSVNGDVLTGGRLDDWLDGGAGDDIFEGGHGNDKLHDTAGDASFHWYESQQSQSTLGADYISSSADSD